MTLPAESQTIKAVVVYNPFDVSDRVEAELEFQPGRPLGAYLDGLPESVTWDVALNRTFVPASAYAVIVPQPGDVITAAPVLEGGGGGDNGKSVLAIVATIALAVVAPMAGGSLATSMGFASSGVMAAVLTAGIQIAGGLLIAAMIPPPDSPEKQTGGFGIDGPKNTQQEGVVVPVLYGNFGWGGNYVDLYTENDTDEDGKSIQFLYGRTVISEGPVQSISGFKLNDQPIENFSDVETDFRLGDSDETISPWFRNTVSLIADGRTVTTAWQARNTLGEVDRLRIDVAFPQGLFGIEGDGDINTQGVWLNIRFRKIGDATWTYLNRPEVGQPRLTVGGGEPAHPTASRNGSGSGISTADDGGDRRNILVNERDQVAVRRSFLTPVLPLGQYEVELRRTHEEDPDSEDQDGCVWVDLGEVVIDPVQLVNTAWAGFKIKITDQLQGVPKFTGDCVGRVFPIYDHNGNVTGQSASNNPADVALDMYLNTRFGGQMEPERIDWAQHAEWRDACVEDGLTFDWQFTELSDIDSEIKHVYIAGRAQRITSGARLSVGMDRPSEPVMMFGAGNIAEGSFELSYISASDRVNDIELAYADASDGYRRHTVRQVNEAALNRGEQLKTSTILLKGITDTAKADREAVLRMNMNNLINRVASWESPVEALHCTVGDVVLVQHNMPRWNEGGRLKPGSTTAQLLLDHPVTFEAGKTYNVLVHEDTRMRRATNISAQTANLVTVDYKITDVANARRLVVGAEDLAITRVMPNATTTDLLLETRAQFLTLSGAAEVWSTDRLFEVEVSNPATGADVTTDTVNLAQILATPPTGYENYMLGEVSTLKKAFRVKTIGRESSGVIPITAVEYNELVYADTPQNPSVAPAPVNRVIANVIDLDAKVTYRKGDDGRFDPRVQVTWRPPVGDRLYLEAVVLASYNGGPFNHMVTTAGFRHDLRALQGDKIKVKVLAVTEDGTAPAATAPERSVTVTGRNIKPAVPTGWGGTSGLRSITLSSTVPRPSHISRYQIHGGVTGSAFSQSSILGETSSTTWSRVTNDQDGVERYWITAVDTAGNVSDETAPIDVLPGFVVTEELDPGLDARIQDGVDALAAHLALVGTYSGATLDQTFAQIDQDIADGVVSVEGVRDITYEVQRFAAQIGGKGTPALADQMFGELGYTLSRFSSTGTLVRISNETAVPAEPYGFGQTLDFTLADATQQDGLVFGSDIPAIWTGPQNADAYVVEVEFTLVSGGLGGAGILVDWDHSGAASPEAYRVAHNLSEGLLGPVVLGEPMTASFTVPRPDMGADPFTRNQVYLMAGFTGFSEANVAKRIKLHRLTVRVADPVDTGADALAVVQSYSYAKAETDSAIAAKGDELTASITGDINATLTQDYLTAVDTNAAITALDTRLSADIGVAQGDIQDIMTLDLGALSGTAIGQFKQAVTVSAQRDDGVLTSQYLKSGWTAYVTAPTSTANTPDEATGTPEGQTWQWNIGAVSAGMETHSNRTEWVGAKDTESFEVEIDFELISGSLDGAGILIDWENASGGEWRVGVTLASMVQGAAGVGKHRATATVTRPAGFTGTFSRAQVYVMANFGGNGLGPITAKNIKVSRVKIRPSSAAEAGVVAQGSAIADIEGNLSAAYLLRVNAGGSRASMEMVAYEDITGGAGSLIRFEADDVLFESSVSARHLSITDAGRLFSSSFETDDEIGDWKITSGTGEMTVAVDAGSTAGGKVLQIGNNAGNDALSMHHKSLIPFDPSKLYKLEARVRRSLGNGTIYLGWAGFDANGVLCNTAGATAMTAQHFTLARAVSPGAFTTYTGYTKGHAASGDLGEFPDPAAPGRMHANVRYIAPIVIANDVNQTGRFLVDFIRAELMADGTTISPEGIDTPHLKSGAVTTEKLTIGTSKNLLINSQFAHKLLGANLITDGPVGASASWGLRPPGNYAGVDYNTIEVRANEDTSATGWAEVRFAPPTTAGGLKIGYPVKAGQWVEGHAQLYTLRSAMKVTVLWFDEAGVAIGGSVDLTAPYISTGNGSIYNPDEWDRSGGRAQAPAGAAFVRLGVRLNSTTAVADGYLFIHKPFLGICESANAPFSEWNPGPTTVIDAATGILTKSITAASGVIGDLAVNNLQIAGEAVSASRSYVKLHSPYFYNGSNTWVDAHSTTITVPHDMQTLFFVDLDKHGNYDSGSNFGLRLIVGGENIVQREVTDPLALNGVTGRKFLTAGTHTLVVQSKQVGWNNNSSGFRGIQEVKTYAFGASK